ncbi:unnamed protein product [Paramecium octaurelia]|nr:unnamed protein product [Paramecium octaurelia]
MDALSNFEQALQIKNNALRFKFKVDSLFELRRKQEAKYFYLAAQGLGLGQNAYIQSQLSKL